MPFGAIISAAGNIGSAFIGANASQKASQQQLQFQGNALSQLQSILSPILNTGRDITNSALGPLTKLLTPGADMTATLSQLPGFKFAQDWGQQAVTNQGTRMGLGGNVLTAGANYATGLAQQGYGNIVSQLQGFLNSGLSTMTGTGSALANGTAGIFGNMGQAAAAGTLGSANALSGGLQGATGAVGNAFTLKALLDKFSPQKPNNPGIYSGGTGENYASSDTSGTGWG